MLNTIPDSVTEGGVWKMKVRMLSDYFSSLFDVSKDIFDHLMLVVRLFDMRVDIVWKNVF